MVIEASHFAAERRNLPMCLDETTLSVLDRRNELIAKQDKKKLTNKEAVELNQIFQTLNSLGINTTDRDPLYQRFIVAISKRDEFQKKSLSTKQLKDQNEIALEILDEILKEKKSKK